MQTAPAVRERLTEVLSEIVAIDARNPWLIPGAPGETEIAAWFAARVEALGIPVELEPISPGRPNGIARLGSGEPPVLCLNAHLDTVGDAGWPDRCYSAALTGDRLVGLGAADDKGHCAALLVALEQLLERKIALRGTLLLAWVADEEAESQGTSELIVRHPMDACIVAEPLGLGRALVSHQGFGWLDVTVAGRAAHGSAPEKGIDAIARLAELTRRLDAHAERTFRAHPHPLNGVTVYHASTVRGGTDYATYPADATLGIEIGTQPGETIEDRVAEIEAIVTGMRVEFPDLEARVDVRLHRPPFEANGHERLWDALDGASRDLLGRSPEPVGENAWMDTGLLGAAGIPSLSIGAAGENFHAPDESVDMAELASVTELLIATVERYLA